MAEIWTKEMLDALPIEEDSKREPPVGTYAATARLLAECGVMSGDEADEWKEMMKDLSMEDE